MLPGNYLIQPLPAAASLIKTGGINGNPSGGAGHQIFPAKDKNFAARN